MRWDYTLPRKDALVNVIGKCIDKRVIDVHEIAREVEKYIKATHLKRKKYRKAEEEGK